MKLNSKRPRFFGIAVTAAALVVPALAIAPVASANAQKVDGVHAKISHGTLQVRGGDQANTIALRLKPGDASVIQVDVGDNGSAEFSFGRSDIEAINVKTGDGNDNVRVDDANGAFTNTIPTNIAGGDGNDVLTGGLGAETFNGGDGNDVVIGGKGNDTAYLGDGGDTFVWNQGDGSDVVEGQDGADTLVFNGAAINETATLSAKNGRLDFFRVQGNVTIDTNGVETVDDNTLGGNDNVTVNDLSGTDVTQTNIDLAGALGGNAGDGAVDNVVVNGTDGNDNIAVNGAAGGVDVTGLASVVSVKHADVTDTLSINTGEGSDNVFTSGIAGVLQVLVDGSVV